MCYEAGSVAFPDPQFTPDQWRFVAELMLAGKHYE